MYCSHSGIREILSLVEVVSWPITLDVVIELKLKIIKRFDLRGQRS